MKYFFQFLIVLFFFSTTLAHAIGRELRIGIIASMTGFAAPYGKAVVEGAQVAAAELAQENVKVRLFIEDDRSAPRNAATAYLKLKSVDNIEALIGGSWWINSIVKTVERDSLPFISCETLFNKDFVRARTYFSLAGDLRNWIRAFRPLVEQKKWRSVLMVRFVSGFADTLETELAELFKAPSRNMLPSLTYSDLEMTGAATFATRVASLKPDVVFLDAQPETFAAFVRELQKLRADGIAIITHSVAEDAIRQGLIDPKRFDDRIFFLRRSSYSPALMEKFRQFKYGAPQLNADLGYYALRLSVQALRSGSDPVATLKEGLTVDGTRFTFDDNNVSHAVVQEVFGLQGGAPVRWDDSRKPGESGNQRR